MSSFLIVKTSAIGDVVQTFPVLEYLRSRFPQARIDWIAEKSCSALVASHPMIDNVYSIDTKSWRRSPFTTKTWKEILSLKSSLRKVRYDALFDLQSNTKSALFTLFGHAEHKVGFGLQTVHEKLNFLATNVHIDIPRATNVRERYLKLVQSYFKDTDVFVPSGVILKIQEEERSRIEKILMQPSLQNTPRIMVAFGSKWRNKQLSLPTLKEFLLLLQKELECSFLFIFGNEDERIIAEELRSDFIGTSDAIGKMSLPMWQALMDRMDAVIAMDSAALHLSGTTSTPSFSVFGPSLASIFYPGGMHYAYQGSCPYGKVFEKQCPILRTCKTGSCIRDIKEGQLFDSFMAWWKGSLLKV